MKFQLIFLGLFAFAAGLFAGYQYKDKMLAKNAPKGNQWPTPTVTTITLKQEKVKIEEEYPARVAANRVVEVRPQVSGILLKRLFDEGKDVVAGQPLYQIDPAPYEQAVNKAKADLEKASTSIKLLEQKSARYLELIKSDGISKQEVDDVEAALAVARAERKSVEAVLEQSLINLNYTKILAPVAGRTNKSIFNEGSLVTSNQAQALTVITLLNPINVDISQANEDFQRLRDFYLKNEKIGVRAYLTDNKLYEQEGELQFSSVLVESTTGSLQLRSVFPNPNLNLLPGMFVKTRITVKEQDGILVPQRATQRNPDGELLVWLVNSENKIQPTVIKSSRTVGNNWLVEEGVKPGDRIVYKGFQKASAGDTVQVKEGF